MSLLPWQKSAWQRLWQQADRMPTNLLFYGPAGIGKRIFAEHLAQAILCGDRDETRQPCGSCTSCTWFTHRSHPDIMRLEPKEADEPATEMESTTKRASGYIVIGQIRGLDDFLYQTTHLDGSRIVIIDQLETLNPYAANAFLKKLEEPPPATYYLLITAHRNRLMPTILSRCCELCPGLPGREESEAWLNGQGFTEAQKWLARAGSPLAALAMAEEGRDDSAAVVADWEALLKEGIVSVAESIDKRINEKKSPEAMDRFMAACQKVCHDLVCVAYGLPPRYHPDKVDKIKALARRTDASTLIDFGRRLVEFRRSARHPLNARLVIEQLLLASPFIS